MKWMLLRSALRLERILRVLMLLLIIGGVFGRSTALGPRCARLSREVSTHAGMSWHEATVTLDAKAAAHQTERWSGVASSVHRCAHCSAAECATALPCAAGHSFRELPAALKGGSAQHAPSTPPPQAAT